MKTKSTMTTIDLLRHGECVNGKCFRGWIDVALSEKGWGQMHHSIENNLAPWDRVLSSTLIRCSHFAKRVANEHSIPLHENADLREISFGDWEGESIDHVWQTQTEQANAWYNHPESFTPPNGEPIQQFNTRVVTAFDAMIQQHQSEHLLCVTHGGVIRVLLGHCLNMPLNALQRIDVPYACMSRLQLIHDEEQSYWRFVSHNNLITTSTT